MYYIILHNILLTLEFVIFSCQFVVKEDGDYKVNLMDPDLPLKWEQIEEIVSFKYIINIYIQ